MFRRVSALDFGHLQGARNIFNMCSICFYIYVVYIQCKSTHKLHILKKLTSSLHIANS